MAQVISANFRRRRNGFRIPVRRLMTLLAGLFGLLLVGTVVLYGVAVQVEDHLRKLSEDTRQLNETNRELQIKLNKIQSYRNVEQVSANVPQLQAVQETITVRKRAHSPLVRYQEPQRQYPPVSGY
jgi:hypothetical protein